MRMLRCEAHVPKRSIRILRKVRPTPHYSIDSLWTLPILRRNGFWEEMGVESGVCVNTHRLSRTYCQICGPLNLPESPRCPLIVPSTLFLSHCVGLVRG